MSSDSLPSRVAWLDVVRVLAIFLVVVSHCTDNFVQSPDGSIDGTASYFVSGVRACVPLFVMVSGALLLPMRGTAEVFFKRRFSRVVIPFLIWGIALALLPLPAGEPNWAPTNVLDQSVKAGGMSRTLYNLVMLPINFTNTNIHFWFLYIILGLYLLTPVISPWVEKATRRGLCAFLAVWVFTMFLPYIQHFPGQHWFPQIHGECDWNTRGMTYYFGGYLGYFVLGHFFTRLPDFRKTSALGLAALLFATGWFLTHQGFIYTVEHKTQPKDLEFFIEFLSPNVAMMTAAVFLACRALPPSGSIAAFFARVGKLSFGVFLVHYWVLAWVRDWMLKDWIPGKNAAVAILVLALVTFGISSAIAAILSNLPGKKWTIGV